MASEADSVVRICSKSEVSPGSVKAFAVGDKTLAVYNIDGTFWATDDECTHAAASLADGVIEGDVIECCMHMGSFQAQSPSKPHLVRSILFHGANIVERLTDSRTGRAPRQSVRRAS